MVKSAIYTGFIFEYKERGVSLVANILRGAYLRSSLFLLFFFVRYKTATASYNLIVNCKTREK